MPGASGTCGSTSPICGIYQQIGAGTAALITDPTVNIQTLIFYANGTKPFSDVSQDTTQSNVLFVASGMVSTGKTTVPFYLETAAVMRGPDL